jgi:hypothetical protein
MVLTTTAFDPEDEETEAVEAETVEAADEE